MYKQKPTAYLICGFIGSGKTTFARKLEKKTGAVRITKDEWIIRIFGNKITIDINFEEIDRKVTTLATEIAFNILKSGSDVIFDEGFWVKSQRYEMRRKIINAAAKPVLYYVDCPVDVMKKRVIGRSSNPPSDSFEITEKMFDSYLKYWQPPRKEENYISVK